jgi:L-aspartate oxidase
VHGANRLASNSLLETVVFAKRIVQRTLASQGTAADLTTDAINLPDARHEGASAPARASLQGLMWDKVGIVRQGEGLAEASSTLGAWDAALPAPHDRAAHELANMVLAGRLMAHAALLREESRGAHYRSDFPSPREEWRRHLTFRRKA